MVWFRLLQVGYWLLPQFIQPGDPYLPGGWGYLVRALGWAKTLGLKACVGLHAAPGSQNGLEHSGRKGPLDWDKGENVNISIAFLRQLAVDLQGVNAAPETAGVVEGIQLLNEPWTYFVGGSLNPYLYKDFVQRATDAVLATGWKGQVWYHDGWNLTWSQWQNFLPSPQYSNIFIDRHVYRAFEGFNPGLTPWTYIDITCTGDAAFLQTSSGGQNTLQPDQPQHPVIVGEWSVGLPIWMSQKFNITFPFAPEWTSFHRQWFVAQMQVSDSEGVV